MITLSDSWPGPALDSVTGLCLGEMLNNCSTVDVSELGAVFSVNGDGDGARMIFCFFLGAEDDTIRSAYDAVVPLLGLD